MMPKTSGIAPIIYFPITLLLILFFSGSLSLRFQALAAQVVNSSAPTVYDILQSYDFPAGLLPKGVTGYDLDPQSGKFHAYLNGSCSFSLEGSYKLSYRSTIDGYISKGKVTKLSGISVKVLFLWLNIVEVYRNPDSLEFSVGITSADFPIDSFYISPQCGCGLDCNSQIKEPKIESLISSI